MNRGQKKYIIAAGGLLLLIIGMLIFASAMMKKGETIEQKRNNHVAEEGIHFTGEVVRINGEVISSGIREMGELITSEYYYTHAESFESIRTFLGIAWDVTKKSFVYTVDGDIMAGVDFNKIQVSVDDDAKSIELTIPESRILASEIDHDSFNLVNEKDGWFNDLSAEDVNKTFAHVKEMEEQKAVENGLLTRADENAARILESFVKSSFDLMDYKVTINRTAA